MTRQKLDDPSAVLLMRVGNTKHRSVDGQRVGAGRSESMNRLEGRGRNRRQGNSPSNTQVGSINRE